MPLRAILVSSLLLISGCATESVSRFHYGTSIQASHSVSVPELLGNAEWFDGEPVSVQGVALFRRDRFMTSGIYMSEEDWANWSDAYIYFELPEDFSEAWDEALRLDGTWILVQGVFRLNRRGSLPTPDENVGQGNELGIVTICGVHCGSPGYIEVHRISGYFE